ncbi:NEW3 domain-containing protein [Kribbella sp. CA-293567]|uniref:NEW3 domain-containing protein n=1 Tax=Kribbella sp. CA-293567 TaxID=3002436 RepID=UPI0022DD1B55|nr:NEW3 domain-containing protein [Kribbella sp. CA-293567]WBQ07222.1 NEW3 domain-containing protein [Kribbella sp. CA-293567]
MKKLLLLLAFTATLLVPQLPAAAAGPVEVTISEVDLAGPVIASVDVTVTNRSAAKLSKLAVTFAGPVGWTVSPETRVVKEALKPGSSVTVAFQIRVPEQRPGFTLRTFTATARYSGGEAAGTRTQRSGTPLPNLAAAFNNVAVSNESDPAKGDFDGDGNSFSAQRLAEKGVTPGSTVTALGATFNWPGPVGSKDNAVATGQTFAYSGQGSKLVLLGSGAGQAAVGLVKVWYSDGTSTSGSIGFPNWSFQDAGAHGATLAISTTGRNTPAGYANAEYQYRVFANSLPLDPAKTVELVTLPANGGLHVFGVGIG